jgi:4-hydroxybenzoate polyprenyltransferase
VVVAAALLVYENAIISPTDLSRVNAAFFNVNGMVAVVVLLGGIADRFLAK